MPTYEYMCASGHRYEKREGFDAPARQKCPKCRKDAQRLLSAPAVVFKGSGFYKTDSRSDASSASDDAAPSTSPTPSSDGHGHSHGPGGHTHDSAAATTSTESTAAG